MTTLTQDTRPGAFLISELDGGTSRDTATIKSGENLKPGAVLGKITATAKYVKLAPGAGDGSQAAAAILYDEVDATAGDIAGAVIVNWSASVRTAGLVWDGAVTAGQKTTALAELHALGIKAR